MDGEFVNLPGSLAGRDVPDIEKCLHLIVDLVLFRFAWPDREDNPVTALKDVLVEVLDLTE